MVIINNEDDAQRVLGPRIAAAGGDLKRVHIRQGRSNLSVANLIEKLEPELDKDTIPAGVPVFDIDGYSSVIKPRSRQRSRTATSSREMF